jgi:hypothetical protein
LTHSLQYKDLESAFAGPRLINYRKSK